MIRGITFSHNCLTSVEEYDTISLPDNVMTQDRSGDPLTNYILARPGSLDDRRTTAAQLQADS